MATQVKSAATQLYDEDFYVWSQRQADLLKGRRFGELDLEHLIEEVEDLGGLQEPRAPDHGAPAQAGHSPAQAPRLDWRGTIRTQRSELGDELPGLYSRARQATEASLRDHGEDAAADALPVSCPYTLDRITDDWLP